MPDKTNVNDPENFEVVWDTPDELDTLGLPKDSNKAERSRDDGETSDR